LVVSVASGSLNEKGEVLDEMIVSTVKLPPALSLPNPAIYVQLTPVNPQSAFRTPQSIKTSH